MSQPHVILYGHQGCLGCQAAERYFVEHAIRYEFRDILKEPSARQQFKALGGIGTPLIVVGASQPMMGFDPVEFERLLERARGRIDPE